MESGLLADVSNEVRSYLAGERQARPRSRNESTPGVAPNPLATTLELVLNRQGYDCVEWDEERCVKAPIRSRAASEPIAATIVSASSASWSL